LSHPSRETKLIYRKTEKLESNTLEIDTLDINS